MKKIPKGSVAVMFCCYFFKISKSLFIFAELSKSKNFQSFGEILYFEIGNFILINH